uniref:Programmed cell death protein 7-like n=1 Tax=Saccoglossus kowalevskii TaxID=10224 RepID=A0ABM0GJH5_SACKO|nr:PREDICTED: programmed cell death protein 7-like [Saccoglossus kowalevskii]
MTSRMFGPEGHRFSDFGSMKLSGNHGFSGNDQSYASSSSGNNVLSSSSDSAPRILDQPVLVQQQRPTHNRSSTGTVMFSNAPHNWYPNVAPDSQSKFSGINFPPPPLNAMQPPPLPPPPQFEVDMTRFVPPPPFMQQTQQSIEENSWQQSQQTASHGHPHQHTFTEKKHFPHPTKLELPNASSLLDNLPRGSNIHSTNSPQDHQQLHKRWYRQTAPQEAPSMNSSGLSATKKQFLVRNGNQQFTETPSLTTQPRTMSNISHQNKSLKSERVLDQEWIDDLIRTRNVISRKKAKPSIPRMTVGEFKDLLRQIIQLNAELSDLRDKLMYNIEKDDSAWQYEYRRTQKIQKKLVKLQSELNNEEGISLIKQKVERIKKKRARSRQARKRKCEENEEALKNREELNKKMDDLFNKELERKLEETREKALREEIDKTTFEIRQKKSEATKALKVLKSLRKLRQLRKDAAEKKGYHTTLESSKTFDLRIQSLEKLFNKQRDVYMDEEKTMQVMMEFKQEEDKEREKEIIRKKMRDAAKRIVNSQLDCLFGQDEPLEASHPMYAFRQYYSQAENSYQSLLEIRHFWDSFLTSEGTCGASSIPVNWVFPSESSNAVWNSYLDKTR